MLSVVTSAVTQSVVITNLLTQWQLDVHSLVLFTRDTNVANQPKMFTSSATLPTQLKAAVHISSLMQPRKHRIFAMREVTLLLTRLLSSVLQLTLNQERLS